MSILMLEIRFLEGDEENIRPMDRTYSDRLAVLTLAWCGHILTWDSMSQNCEKTGMHSLNHSTCGILSLDPSMVRE